MLKSTPFQEWAKYLISLHRNTCENKNNLSVAKKTQIMHELQRVQGLRH